MRVTSAARYYLADLKVGKDTARKRRYHLESFCLHLGGDTEVRAVKRQHIEAWLFNREVQPSTLKNMHLTIRTFFDYCVVKGWRKTVPYRDITLPRVARRQPRALNRDQLQALSDTLPDDRARLIVALAVNEGLRRVEIARLELGDIDFHNMTLAVLTAKAGTEDLLPLSRLTHDYALIPYLRTRGRKPGRLILREDGTGGLSADTIGAMVVRWMREAGIKDQAFDGRSLHACRHTYAALLLERGADPTVIQAGLRHSALSSTWTYLRATRDVERLRPFVGMDLREAS